MLGKKIKSFFNNYPQSPSIAGSNVAPGEKKRKDSGIATVSKESSVEIGEDRDILMIVFYAALSITLEKGNLQQCIGCDETDRLRAVVWRGRSDEGGRLLTPLELAKKITPFFNNFAFLRVQKLLVAMLHRVMRKKRIRDPKSRGYQRCRVPKLKGDRNFSIIRRYTLLPT